MKLEISMSSPDLTDSERQAVADVMKTHQLSMGRHLVAFERGFASYLGCRFAAGVNSGTSGLHLAMQAAGVGEGDLVVTTPFSFIASANCILYQKALPVFVDIDPQTANLCPEKTAETIEEILSGKGATGLPPLSADAGKNRLKAILPVHVFGQPADMDPLVKTARRHGLAVVEDACEALGALYKDRPAGSLGDAAVFGFYPNKQLTTGEGGLICSDNEEWDRLFRSLRNQGRDESGSWLNHVRLGYNYRLDEMSAALGLAQLERIEELLAHRARTARLYNRLLQDCPGISLPHIAPTTTRMSWFLYVIRLLPPFSRDQVMDSLARSGIPSRAYFPPIHLQPLYRDSFGYVPGQFPIAETWGQTALALPFSGTMKRQEVQQVCRAVRTVIGSQGAERGKK